jgi:hypothetical protein
MTPPSYTTSLGSRIPNRLGRRPATETFGAQIPHNLRGPGGMKIPVGGKAGAPAKPKPTPGLPYDAAYQAYLADQNRQFATAQAGFAYEGGQEAYQTGFNQNGTANAANPYSLAALLRENYNRSTSGTLNSYASQGQLYSGAYGRQQGENSRNYSIGYNQLANQAASAYQNLSQRESQAAAQYGIGLTNQQRLALYRALFPTG